MTDPPKQSDAPPPATGSPPVAGPAPIPVIGGDAPRPATPPAAAASASFLPAAAEAGHSRPPSIRRRMTVIAAASVVLLAVVAVVAIMATKSPATHTGPDIGVGGPVTVWPAPGTSTPQAAVAGMFDAVFVHGDLAGAVPYVAPFEVRHPLEALLAKLSVKASASGLATGAVTVHGTEATVGVVGRVCGNLVKLVLGSSLECATNTNRDPAGNWRVPCVVIAGAWYVDLALYSPLAPIVHQLLSTPETSTTSP